MERLVAAQAVRRWRAAGGRRQRHRLLPAPGERTGHRPGRSTSEESVECVDWLLERWLAAARRRRRGRRRRPGQLRRRSAPRVRRWQRRLPPTVPAGRGRQRSTATTGRGDGRCCSAPSIGGNIAVPAVDGRRRAPGRVPRRSPRPSTWSTPPTATGRCVPTGRARPRTRSTGDAAPAATPGPRAVLVGLDRARPRPRCTTSARCSRSSQVPRHALPHAGLPAARSHRRRQHAFYTLANGGTVGRRRGPHAARRCARPSPGIACSCCRRRRRS